MWRIMIGGTYQVNVRAHQGHEQQPLMRISRGGEPADGEDFLDSGIEQIFLMCIYERG